MSAWFRKVAAPNWRWWSIRTLRWASPSDYRDVIGKVDAAIVAVPTIAHAEVGCALLEAGIDVLVEKPIAPTLEEADRLVESAEKQRQNSSDRPPRAV